MKPLYLFIISLCLPFMLQAQGSKTLEVTSGNLSSLLTEEEKATLTSLTLTGTVDARDFFTTRDMPLLTELDFSQTSITAINIGDGYGDYHANTIGTYGVNPRDASGLFSERLTSLKLPLTLETIGIGGLKDCSGLRFIEIPPSVTSVEYYAFSGCTGLSSLNIPSSVITIGEGAFSGCSGINELTIPSSITVIPRYGFNSCSSLTSLNFSFSITAIEMFAFSGCTELTTLTLPESFQYIEMGAFMYCPHITSIYSYNPNPPALGGGSFDEEIKNTCTVYVPFGSKEIYAAAEGWKDFTNIEEMPGFSLSANAITIASQNESTGTVLLSSNASWTASSDQSWLTVSPASGNGNETLTFTAERNNTGGARTATVSVSLSEGEPQTVIVTQEVNNPNQAPVAHGGDDQTVNEGATVTLDGSASSDPENDELTYLWTAPEGIELSSLTSVNPTFMAPEVNTDTDFTFTLIVNDGTANSTADEMIITVRHNNRTPIAHAGDDLTVNEGTTVTLDGSASSDPDNDELTYLWTAPEGMELSSATSVNPTFTAPEVSENTNYTFSLIVNDGTANSTVDEVVITVRYNNRVPIANAGDDQTVNEGATVTLDGSASSDPDNDELTYLWTAPEGIELSSVTSSNPTFTAPEVSENTNYTFSLVVNDGTVSSTADEVIITVRHNNRVPVANAGDNQAVNEGSTVTLDGSASSDPDDDELTYLWTAPEGIELSSLTSEYPNFTAPQVNENTNYTFSLIVHDGTVSSTADEVIITVRHNNRIPIANAGDDQTVSEGATVTLNGSASSDPDNDELTYLWTAPEGIELSSVTLVNPTFTAPEVYTDTDFTFILVVNDGTANSTADEVIITVRHNNRVPIANAGVDQTVSEGTTVTLNGSASSDPDDDELTYLWTAPEGIELSSVTLVNPTFTAPEVNTDTDFTFILVVNDGTANSTADEVIIHVERKNNVPVANAGIDLYVHEEVILTLDGSGSSDPDNDELTYQWTVPEGIELSGNSAQPTFTVPEVSEDTVYTFSLVVSDGKDISLVDHVTVTVLNSNINQHFSAVSVGTEDEQMIFYVSMARINGLDLQEGDEIAIYDGLTCVGAAMVRQVLDIVNNLCIKVYLDNPATFIKDGFITGHAPVVRIWNSVTKTEAILTVFDYEPGSSEVFETRSKAMIAIDVVVSGVDDLYEGNTLLGNNYPNPFCNQTTIPYIITRETPVDISIYDMTGRKITTLVHGNLQSGNYTVTWNKNSGVKPGVYICKMQTDNLVLSKLISAE